MEEKYQKYQKYGRSTRRLGLGTPNKAARQLGVGAHPFF